MQKVLRRRDSLHRAAYLGVFVAIHRNPPSRLASALDGYYPLAPNSHIDASGSSA